MLILNAEAIGLLRHQIIEALGFEEARKLLLRFGFQSGYTDCLQMEIGYEWESPMELLAVAPRIHTYGGIVAAGATTVEMDLDADTLLVEGNWYSTTNVDEREGLVGEMELARRTNLPSTKASTADDSPENVQMMREAIREITGEAPPRL